MESKFVCVADYLSYDEGVSLFKELEEAGISALVKSCGPPSIPYGEGLYFQLLINDENLEKASEIVRNFKNELLASRQFLKCPRCRSEAVFKPNKLPFWQKIYYAGTEVFKCENCRKKFAS